MSRLESSGWLYLMPLSMIATTVFGLPLDVFQASNTLMCSRCHEVLRSGSVPACCDCSPTGAGGLYVVARAGKAVTNVMQMQAAKRVPQHPIFFLRRHRETAMMSLDLGAEII